MPGVAHFINERLRALGFEMARYPPATHALSRRRRLMERTTTDLVLDVGANTGQYVEELRRHQRYRGRVVSFEPLASAFEHLERSAHGDPLWEIWPVGLGAFCGSAELQVAGNSRSSSILPMLPAHLAAAPGSACVGTQGIEVRTLDSLFPAIVRDARRVWLKIDTQGYEHQVLAGAGSSLAHIDTIQMEMSLIRLYEGAPMLQQTLALMAGLGFRLVGLEPGFEDAASGELLQADGLFRRSSAR